MQSVNIHDAKTHLSRLVEEAAGGKAFIIAKAGKPMVKVVPLAESAPRLATAPRQISAAGKARVTRKSLPQQ